MLISRVPIPTDSMPDSVTIMGLEFRLVGEVLAFRPQSCSVMDAIGVAKAGLFDKGGVLDDRPYN